MKNVLIKNYKLASNIRFSSHIKLIIMIICLIFLVISCKLPKGSLPDSLDNTPNKKIGVFTNYGGRYRDFSSFAGIFYEDSNNDLIYYGISRSGPVGTLFVFNTNSRLLEKEIVLPGSSGAWAIVLHGSNIYIGTYEDALLYKFDIASEKIELLAEIPNATYIWDISVFDNKLYLATYPEAHVVEYDLINNGITDYGSFSNEKYVRSIEVFDDKIYAGIGANAQLVEYDINSGLKRNILPETYLNQSFVYHMNRVGDKLILGLLPDTSIIEYDIINDTFIELTNNINGLSVIETPTFSLEKKIFRLLGRLFEYNTINGNLSIFNNADTYVSMIVNTEHLIGLTIGGVYKDFNFDNTVNHSIDLTNIGLSGYITLPMSVDAEDGVVYFGGNRLGIFDISTNSFNIKTVEGEAKSICLIEGSLYSANYPGTQIWKYDESELQSSDVMSLLNPDHLIFDIGEEQNRPKIILANPNNNMILIGTEPDYGKYGGALSQFNITSHDSNILRNIVPDHTIYSIYFDSIMHNIAYLGTSVYGGTGTTPLPEDAHLIKWDLVNNKKVFDIIPEVGNEIITSIVHKDDLVYCTTNNGSLISIDSKTGAVINSNVDKDFRHILYSVDGNLYAIDKIGIYQIDFNSLRASSLRDNFTNLCYLTEDKSQNTIYLVDAINGNKAYNLWSYY